MQSDSTHSPLETEQEATQRACDHAKHNSKGKDMATMTMRQIQAMQRELKAIKNELLLLEVLEMLARRK